MPRSKRKRETEATPVPSRRRAAGREASGTEPVGRKNNVDDSEAATAAETTINANDGRQKDPLESDQSNNHMESASAKEQGNGSSRSAKADAGNDHAVEPLKENATGPLHEKEEKIASDLIDPTSSGSSNNSKKGKHISAGSEEGKSDSRIKAILSHRKLLLTRLQQGRAAVQNRLDHSYKQNPVLHKQTDDQEIAVFQLLAKEATSLARKVKADGEGAAEKRTSVSLRRGSSVGKKMNAALSSLAPGTANIAAAAAAANAASASVAPPVATAQVPVPKSVPSAAPVKSTAPTIPASSAPIPQVAAPLSAVLPKKPPAVARTASKAARPASTTPRSSTPSIAPPFSHTNLLGAPSRVAQPIKNVPECILLREKRRTIRHKLAALAQQSESEQSLTLRDKSRKPIDWHQRHKQSLPPRRKTQWDYLLEEMRWMATDFKQERGWKMARARSLSDAVKKELAKSSSPATRIQSILQDTAEKDAVSPPLNKDEELDFMEEDIAENGNDLSTQEQCRVVARRLSNMVSEFVTAYSSVTARDAEPQPGALVGQNFSRQSPTENASVLPSNKLHALPESERNNIIESINQIVSKATELKRKSRSMHCKVEGTQLQFSGEQARVLHLLEDKLSTTKSGALLEGSYSCGKTIVTLALLSRSNGDGPHLVLCPTKSIVKWVDRAKYFQHIHVRSLGSILETELAMDTNDLIVCDHKSLHILPRVAMENFKSIIVDCRHPWGFRGSKLGTNKKDAEFTAVLADFYPKELISDSWWALLSNCAITCTRRLLVENKSSGMLADMFSGLHGKNKLDLIASRVGFVAGIESKGEIAITKILIGWARKQIKRVESEGTKFERVVRQLVSVLDSFACSLSSSNQIEEAPDGFSFDVHKCEMTQIQRLAYDTLCSESRRILSSPLCEIGADQSLLEQTASCLLKLRRTCMHSDMESLLENPLVRSAMNSFLKPGNRAGSASQPNQELALQIMEGSGKLSHLASFLSSESSVPLSKETQNSVWRKEGKRKSVKVKHSPMKNKVVVLASLPEIQILISVFLLSLGINHEYIPDEFGTTQCWISGQVRLTGFNHQNPDDPSATNIVICSLVTIAGDHGGVGVDTADAVISVDEDWSGRGELLFNALLHRFWCALNKQCRFIKLVAAGTSEEQFIVNGDFAHFDQKKIRCSVSPLGLFTKEASSPEHETKVLTSMLDSRSKPESWFGFPGLNMFAVKNESLSEVLSTSSPLKRRFGLDKPLLFLPSDGGKNDDELWIKIIFDLIAFESKCFLVSRDSLDSPSKLTQALCLLRTLESGGAIGCDEEWTTLSLHSQEGDHNKGITLGIPSSNEREFDITMELERINSEENDLQDRLPQSSLFYRTDSGVSSKVLQRRSNAFVDSFTSHFVPDSRTRVEALPYFPPLFPRMVEASILAENSVAMLESSGIKRRLLDNPDGNSDAKRKREDQGNGIPAPGDVVTEGNAQRADIPSVLMELADDYGLAGVGALPLSQDSVLAAAIEQQNVLSFGSCSDTGPTSMILIVTRKRHRAPHGNATQAMLTPRDTQQAGPWNPVQGVVLPMARSNAATKAGAIVGGMDVSTGKSLKKKATGPKQAPLPAGQVPGNSDDARGQVQPQTHGPRMLEAIRGRLLVASRQSGVGTSIFETPSFRAAFVRIRHRLGNCTARDCWHSNMIMDAGPGLPLHACKRESGGQGFQDNRSFWTTIVKRLKSESGATGDEALLASGAQRAGLRRSLSAPCRVDFGPFQSGFLSSPSGMTAIVPPRPRGGVSLPMGVKVPPPTKDLHVTWSESEEKALRECVLRFGSNWMLAARTLSGFQDAETVSQQSPGIRPVPRAARSSREHWHIMVRKDPNLARDLRHTERLQREKASHRFDQIDLDLVVKKVSLEHNETKETDGEGDVKVKGFLLPSVSKSIEDTDEEKNADHHELQNDPGMARKRRSFRSITAAKTKRIQIPRTIPGVQSGSQPTTSPSHPSHMQAVQKSPSSKWSSGRTDMWPIQFLDAADRHRNPPLQSSTQHRAQAPSRPQGSTSTSNGRPAYPQPPHRAPSSGSQRPPPMPGTSGAAPARPASSTATMQSFAPPASKTRQSEDGKK